MPVDLDHGLTKPGKNLRAGRIALTHVNRCELAAFRKEILDLVDLTGLPQSLEPPPQLRELQISLNQSGVFPAELVETPQFLKAPQLGNPVDPSSQNGRPGTEVIEGLLPELHNGLCVGHDIAVEVAPPQRITSGRGQLLLQAQRGHPGSIRKSEASAQPQITGDLPENRQRLADPQIGQRHAALDQCQQNLRRPKLEPGGTRAEVKIEAGRDMQACKSSWVSQGFISLVD